MSTPDRLRSRSLAATPSLRAAWPALLLALLVPMYFVIGVVTAGRTLYTPELALERAVPVQPAWSLVYGSLYVFALLPLFVVRQQELFRRVVLAYLTAVIVAYVGFFIYPAAAPRPERVAGDGFFPWCVRFIYWLDTPYNCFPSLHVAYSFLAALTCYRVHRGIGVVALGWAALIGVSTLFIKQHFLVDVLAGAFIAYVAYLAWLRRYPREEIPEADRRRAAVRALAAVAMFAVMVASFWAAYMWRP